MKNDDDPRANPEPVLPSRYWQAFLITWLIYMKLALTDGYDGVMTWLGQPVLGAVFAVLAVCITALLGLLLKVPTLAHFWQQRPRLALGLIVGSALLLIFGQSLGFREAYFDSDQGLTQTRLPAFISLPAFFTLLFAITYRPGMSKTTIEAAAM